MYDAPDVTPPRALIRGYVTFASFNALSKVNDRVAELWAQVLAAVPNSRMIIKSISGLDNPRAQHRLTQIFSAAGIDPDRVALQTRVPDPSGHLQLYRMVDIALDTYPYHGTTITCEALWMGVPVVTLLGRAHASRVGLSLLTAAGLENLAANTPEEYVQIAAKLAADLPRLTQIRSTLRDRLSKSPLTNAQQFARNVESAYREMWRSFCSPLPGTPGRGQG
jgi:protein O-GlcNAc transferase